MNITAENLRHWANCASLTSEQVSCLSVPQLNSLAEIIDRLENEKAEVVKTDTLIKLSDALGEKITRIFFS